MEEVPFFLSAFHEDVVFSFHSFICHTVRTKCVMSYFSGKVHPSGADCPFFIELYNSMNVHDVEKLKIMLHGIKTLLE